MKDAKRLIPGALISIALIAAVFYFIDFGNVLKALRVANYRILAVAMALSFLWLTVRAKVWQTLLRDKPPYREVFFATGEGYLLNNFLPFRLGELGRAFLLSRNSGMKFAEILPTIFIERAVDLAFSAAILLISLPYVVGSNGSERIGIAVSVVVVIGLVVMYILARNNQWALDIFHKLTARWPALQRTGGNFLELFFTGLGVLTDGWLFVRFLLWMTFDWAIALAAYYLMILAFFPEAQWVWGAFILGAAAFGGAIPSLPGAVGTFEGAVVGALTLFTGDQSTALAVSLTARFYNYLNSGVIGGIGLMREGESLAGVYKELMALRKKEE
jgi:glycosyltransferase 2 family protein